MDQTIQRARDLKSLSLDVDTEQLNTATLLGGVSQHQRDKNAVRKLIVTARDNFNSVLAPYLPLDEQQGPA